MTGLAAVQATWNGMPDLYQPTARIKLSLLELAALEVYAASQNKSVETFMNELFANAVKTAVAPLFSSQANTMIEPTPAK